jgi:formylglycine-generating enzyme required for sulfatase activity
MRPLLPLAFIALGCAPPPAQVVFYLDTDLPVVAQLAARPELSNDASMDSVRIDLFDDAGQPFDVFDVVAPDPLDWPLSFGVASDGKSHVRLRARLFRGQHASAGQLNGRPTIEPEPAITVDRVIDLPLPRSGITTIEVLLAGDCLGVPPVFGAATLTCIDAVHQGAPPTEGIVVLADRRSPPSRVGTWPKATEVPCSHPTAGSRICIPGGFSLLGDTALRALDGLFDLNAGPPVPVLIPPFYLDKYEFTVGEFDQLLAEKPGAIAAADLPLTADSSSPKTQFCTWLGGKPGHEQLPLNCLTPSAAAQICTARGGQLVSEAEWEHAARGRGQHRAYPWGDAPPSCCTGSFGGPTVDCGHNVEPVGSHLPSDACGGLGDVSRDGVVDLGGSLTEHTRDAFAQYSSACWQAIGVLRDPMCTIAGTSAFVARGGSWQGAPESGLAALRYDDAVASFRNDYGVRCMVPDGAP